jgi:hypothetical protein
MFASLTNPVANYETGTATGPTAYEPMIQQEQAKGPLALAVLTAMAAGPLDTSTLIGGLDGDSSSILADAAPSAAGAVAVGGSNPLMILASQITGPGNDPASIGAQQGFWANALGSLENWWQNGASGTGGLGAVPGQIAQAASGASGSISSSWGAAIASAEKAIHVASLTAEGYVINLGIYIMLALIILASIYALMGPEPGDIARYTRLATGGSE